MSTPKFSTPPERPTSQWTRVPEELALLPLRNAVLLPGGVLSITAGRPKTLAMLHDINLDDTPIGVVTQRASDVDDPTLDDVYPVGTLARVVKKQQVGPQAYLLVVQGLSRFHLDDIVSYSPYWKGSVSPAEESSADSPELRPLFEAIRTMVEEAVEVLPDVPSGVAEMLRQVEQPAALPDLIAANLDLQLDEKIKVLEALDLEERLKRAMEAVSRLRAEVEIKQKINNQVREELARGQKETILRQQLKAIQDELGDGGEDELGALEHKLRQANLPADAEKVVNRELKRIRRMSASQADYHVIRTYLETVGDLPWNKQSEDHLDIPKVEQILNERHSGLEKVKRRILEHLAVLALNPNKKGAILCLAGPPGVGKTSLGQAIADSMGRKFVRASFGGVRDEAEIRGHRRTYVGAMPGRIIAGLRKAGTRNPVFLLDEIDKLSSSHQGDPASALLEVLDPEQNHKFSDHYLEVDFDLSKVLFIATANNLSTIPGPLRDRLEIIDLPGYAIHEKKHIARHHLLPRQIKEHGLTEEQLVMSDEMLTALIEGFTREAGVRTLERSIGTLCRTAALVITKHEGDKLVIDDTVLEDALGNHRHFPEVAERTELPGVATGLAWTAVGGDLLFIESTRMTGKGKLILTGQLGDVMKESAQAAMSYVRSNTIRLGIDEDFQEKYDIHIHIPAGAIPKDGPSAGVTMFTALTSLLTGRKVRSDVAMTGEATLRGRVLPVGGIKEKVLAAHRGGIKRVIMPDRCKRDIKELPAEVQADLEFVFVQEMSEVLIAALVDPPEGLLVQPEVLPEGQRAQA